MKIGTVVHISDLHIQPTNKARRAFSILHDEITHVGLHTKTQSNFLLITGDLFHRELNFSAATSGLHPVNWVYNFLDEMSRLFTAVFIIKGNNSHDEVGSVIPFHQYRKNVFATEKPVLWGVDTAGRTHVVSEPGNAAVTENIELFIPAFPYIDKHHFPGSHDDYEELSEAVREMFRYFHTVMHDTPHTADVHRIAMLHQTIAGTKLDTNDKAESTDHLFNELVLTPSDLLIMNCDYYALGHIHKPQQIRDYQMYYAGSLYPLSFKEADQKRFIVITPGEQGVSSHPINGILPSRTVTATFSNGSFTIDAEKKNIDTRIMVSIREDERKLFTTTIADAMKAELETGENVVEIREDIQRVTVVRSEEILNQETLIDEVIEFNKLENETTSITSQQKELIQKIEGIAK